MTRVAVIADLHCGHKSGLSATNIKFYAAYKRIVQKLLPVDILICNGDMIDGRGERSGGTEVFTTDRIEQCKLAEQAIMEWKATDIFMSYGTPYHTGKDEDFEDIIRENVRAAWLRGLGELTVNGCNINFKHKIGGSTVPYGRATAIAKERQWNLNWHLKGRQKLANIIIRSHVHYHSFCGGIGPDWLAITTPCLQDFGSKYGERQCSGTIDHGVTVFDIDSKGHFSWWVEKLIVK